MKNVIFTLLCIFLLSACIVEPTDPETCEINTILVNKHINKYYYLQEITIVGDSGPETHEYLYYTYDRGIGFSHWEGCKYCKNK